MQHLMSNCVVVALVAASATVIWPSPALAAVQTTPNWYKVDTHMHSSVSGDARVDLGIAAAKAQAAGYNAVFLADHDRAASFQIQGANGNYLSFSDADALTGRWAPRTRGSLSSSAASVVSSPVHSGTKSLHLQASSASSGQSMVFAKRGPSLRAGGVTLDFWVLPQQISAGSGVDVSVALGGDSTIGTPWGYTTSAGTATVGKSTVLVWQLGAARASSVAGTKRVVSNALGYTVGRWNHYQIDLNSGTTMWTPEGGIQTSVAGTGVAELGTDVPADHVVLSQIKMEAAASAGGTADAYLDDYVIKNATPNCPAADFVYRNSVITQLNAPSTGVKLFAAREMGQNGHTNQFNFGITSAAQYYDNYVDTAIPAPYGDDSALCASTNTTSAPWKFSRLGYDNIVTVQNSGYPAQNNHPGVTDTKANVISTRAHGADAVELRSSADYSDVWDAILQQNHIITGTYGSDSHEGVSSSSPSDFIDAASLTLDDLMRSYFEGRMYLAPGNFSGRILLTTDGGARPYPARYPTLVSPTATAASVKLAISGGLSSGQKIRWITNSGSGPVISDVPVSGSTYSAARSIPLSGSFTYVRAEVRDSTGGLLANTEPIFFRTLSGLPADKSIHVDAVTSTGGCSCSVVMTKGITSSSWGPGGLTLNLTNPLGSIVNLLGTSAASPSRVVMDGVTVPVSTSLSAYRGSTGDAWYYDAANQVLYLQDKQSGTTSIISVAFGS